MAAPASTPGPLRVRAVRAEQVGAGGGRPPPLSRLRPFRTPAPRAGARLAGGAQSVWRTRRPHESAGGHTHPPESPGGHRRLPDAVNRGGRRARWTLRRPHASCSAAAGGGQGGGDARHWPHSAWGAGHTEASPHRVSLSGPLRPANPARLLSRVFALAASGPKGHGAGLMGSVLDCREGRTRSDPFSRGGGAPRGTRPSVCTGWDTTPQSCHPKTHDVPRVRVASPHVTRVPLGRRPTPPRRRVSPPEP